MLEVILLGLALFHGLNGVRTVILDFDVGIQGSSQP
jgi:succinate dehydrogenase/fumarate reductase cytochrome b subunit